MLGNRVWFVPALAAVFAAANDIQAQSPDSGSTDLQVTAGPPTRRLTLEAAHHFRTQPIPIDSVVPGSRMRLVARSFVTERQGIVAAVHADTLVFAMPDKHVVRRIPPSDVVQSWVSVGKAPSGANALKIAGLGAIIGTSLAQLMNGRSRHDPGFLSGNTIVAGVATGAMIGGIVGSLRVTDVWRPVKLPR